MLYIVCNGSHVQEMGFTMSATPTDRNPVVHDLKGDKSFLYQTKCLLLTSSTVLQRSTIELKVQFGQDAMTWLWDVVFVFVGNINLNKIQQ